MLDWQPYRKNRAIDFRFALQHYFPFESFNHFFDISEANTGRRDAVFVILGRKPRFKDDIPSFWRNTRTIIPDFDFYTIGEPVYTYRYDPRFCHDFNGIHNQVIYNG